MTAPAQADLPELLTAGETIRYLRLDVDERDPDERLRNLIRRQGLPCIRRGRLQLFPREALQKWLGDGRPTSNKKARLTATNGAGKDRSNKSDDTKISRAGQAPSRAGNTTLRGLPRNE